MTPKEIDSHIIILKDENGKLEGAGFSWMEFGKGARYTLQGAGVLFALAMTVFGLPAVLLGIFLLMSSEALPFFLLSLTATAVSIFLFLWARTHLISNMKGKKAIVFMTDGRTMYVPNPRGNASEPQLVEAKNIQMNGIERIVAEPTSSVQGGQAYDNGAAVYDVNIYFTNGGKINVLQSRADFDIPQVVSLHLNRALRMVRDARQEIGPIG